MATLDCINEAAKIALARGPVAPEGIWKNLPNDLIEPFRVYRVEIEGQLLCEAAEFLVRQVDDPIAFIVEEIRGVMMGFVSESQ
jgi:hypothetical protein